MYTLYWSPDTGAFAVQAVLEELGQPYRLELVSTKAGAHRRPEYKAINPMGQVPALGLPDGTALTETAAILLHLGDLHPEAGLMPAPGTPGRGRLYRLMFWMAANLYETDLRCYYADRYTTAADGAEGVRDAAKRRLGEMLALAETFLGDGPFLLGAQVTVADHYLFMLLTWHPDGPALLTRLPGLAAHAARLRARPAVAAVWAQHHPREGGDAWSTWTGSSAS